MKRLLLPLLLAATQTQAAPTFSAAQTTGVQTFNTTPPAGDWSTVSLAGAAGTLATVAAVDAAAQALTAAGITTQLGTQAATLTNAMAQRSSNSNFIYTAATGNNATALMATLQNSSGAAVNAITIAYDYTRIGTATEEAMGHRVFVSLTGAANSWTLISPLSGIATNQALSTTVTLSSAWANAASLYLLWVDDNGSGTDTPFTIDNFVVTGGNPAPSVALTAPTAGASAFSPGSFNLAANASDNGSVTQVEFLRNGTVIHTDTTEPYAFTDSGLSVGSYSYTARATDNQAAVTTSAAVAVTVTLDPNNLPTNTALWFDGVNDYVTMGTALDLGVGGPPTNGMTLECWFRRDGSGVTSSSGNGGVTAVPLFGKGRGEAEGSNVDCNYFFGITTAGVLVADFEAYPATGITAGQNYPITATNTPITNGTWNHAAVTYDGPSFTWRIYLNGVQVGTATAVAGALPRYDSIQHFGIGAAMTSTGAREGAFHGVIDEVRVWNYARSAAEIAATKDVAIASSPGLVGRYGLNEGTGTTTASSTGTSAGTLTNGPLWIEGATLVMNTPPTVAITAPANNASFNAPAAFSITADASDPGGTISKVEFFNGATKIGEDTMAPYTLDVSSLAQGSYSYTARATDNFGAFTNSAVVNVSVGPPLTTPPTVSISSPADGSSFLAPAAITINANAADSDGSVTKVEFFNGATKLGEDTTAPYSFVWSDVAIGSYSLTAKATDEMTASTTSAAITVNVVLNQNPTITLSAPADLTTNAGTGGTVALSASVLDPESQPMSVTFYGRLKSPPAGPDFTLMTLPDTQFYSENLNNRFSQFTSQTNWIVSSRTALNTVFVSHMGDMVNTASVAQEWTNAKQAMSLIEDPVTTLLTHGIPWGGAPGNHDGTGTEWDTHFGLNRWSGKTYFQGGYNSSNRNNYQFFSASGLDFIVIHLDYNANTAGNQAIMDWADALLKAHPNRRAIVTSHWLIGTSFPPAQAAWGGHGQALYDNLKDNPNLFLMLCGHIHGEGRRADVFEGRTVYTVLQDYQSRSGYPGGFGGGDAWLRYFIFSPANNSITAKTYRTTTGDFETDADSEFTLPYTMGAGTATWTALGTVNASGGTATLEWTGLAGSTEYEWYAAVSDGTNAIGSSTRSFTTAANTAPTVSLTAPAAAANVVLPAQVLFEATAADADGSVSKVEFYAGATKVGEDSTAPFSFAWSAISGSYVLTAIATDNQGATTTSAVVNITVTNPANVPPTVSITSPTSGFSTENSTLTINANAVDTDGTITKVEFYQGSTKLGEDTTAPYAYNWTGIAVGSYTLTAVAIDNDSSSVTSAAVSVTFTPPGNFLGSMTQNFDSMGTAGTTPPGTWTVWNAASGTSNSTWTSSVLASNLPAMVAVTPLTATTTPSGNNLNGFNAAASAGNTANRALASSPTTVAGMAFQLLLTNGTGGPIDALKISYDTLRYTAVSTANELPGYWLFFSLDGGSTWTNVSSLNPTITSVPNTTGTSITALTTISLGANWNAGSQLRLRWVDDNAAQTSPDQIIGLDNVSIIATVIDTDGDGLSDAWETANGTNPAVNDANSNDDGDANNALLEYAFGTNPTVSDGGVLEVNGSSITRRGDPTLSTQSISNGVDFRAVFCRRKNYIAAGLIYTVQFSADLGTWQSSIVTPTVIADDGEMQVVTVRYPFFVNGQKARFFRVSVSQN
jgi:Concanavalin A-like lectin/glucanases superfamily/Bacterial Ig domain/Bacterial TSP3 repeat/Calcineurin-like phosphoesterase